MCQKVIFSLSVDAGSEITLNKRFIQGWQKAENFNFAILGFCFVKLIKCVRKLYLSSTLMLEAKKKSQFLWMQTYSEF